MQQRLYSLARGQIVVKDASTGEIVNHGDGLLTWSEKKLNPATIVVEMEQAGQGLSMPLLLEGRNANVMGPVPGEHFAM